MLQDVNLFALDQEVGKAKEVQLHVDVGGVKTKTMSKAKLKSISGKLKKASKAHASQSQQLDKVISTMKKVKQSPALKKLSASCKAAAKRKFKVYPSAYANMWAAKTQRQGKCQMYSQGNNPFKKKMGDFKHSDAPDAKGKFKSLSASGLASWMIKSRKGNLSRIISSLNQQVVFNRGKNPSYAAKMKKTMNIVRKRLGKDKK